MSQQALLERLVAALEGAGIPYMLSGSLASSLQGEPRATHDIDLVIDVAAISPRAVFAALSAPDLYVDDIAVDEAVRRRGTFNLIDPASGDKADFWLLKDEPYDHERFSRRRRVAALGLQLVVSSPEDTILMKLRWAAESGGSEKQSLDAAGVYDLQAGSLDEAYLDRWAEKLGVTQALADARTRSQA
jgi:hypothetical protein